MAADRTAFKPVSMADSLLLPAALFFPSKPSLTHLPFPLRPAKPHPLLTISCARSASSISLGRRKTHFHPLVAQTSDWARQDEEESDGPGLEELDGEEPAEDGEVVAEGEDVFVEGEGDEDEDFGILCEACNGRGWLLCSFCEGRRNNVMTENNRIYRRCPTCKAVGYVLCSKCKVFKCITFPDDSDGQP